MNLYPIIKKHNFFKTLFILVFLLFLALFIASKTGYYEKSVKDKTYLTNKKLKEFEKDISEGKNVDAKDYFPKEVDYSNVFTKSANNISNKIGLVVNYKAKNIWDFIKTLFIS